jgi:Holliday junction resolvase-like predicted endonuclease
VAKAHYQKQNYKFLVSRWQSAFAEIDLVFKDPNGLIVLVEVKSLTKNEYLGTRLTWQQKQRLSRVLRMLSERGKPCRLELAVVSQSGEVQCFSDVFG